MKKLVMLILLAPSLGMAADPREKTAAESLLVKQNEKSPIQDLSVKISKRCKIPDSQIEANNWVEISGLSVSILSDCPEPVTQVIESLNEIRREMKLKSVRRVAFFDSVNSYRTFPAIQVVIRSGYVERGNGSRRAITTTYAFSTQILDLYLRGKISANEFKEKWKTVEMTPK